MRTKVRVHLPYRTGRERGFWSDVIGFFANLFPTFGKPAPEQDVTERWELGGGGKSGTHCPKCIEFADMGPMPLGFFPQPRTQTTYCEEDCTCEIVASDGSDAYALVRFDDWQAWEAANEGLNL